ncbi:MAG: DUF3343 domain-containing protein [Christensenellales bacterium]
MTEPYGLIVFRSRQQALRMEQELRSAGLRVRVVHTPHEAAAGCGLSVQFDLNDLKRVFSVYERVVPQSLVGFYRAEPEGTRLRCTPIRKV